MEHEDYNPENRLLTRRFVEATLTRLCGFHVAVGDLAVYQTAFVHKSVYRRNLAPPPDVVAAYLARTGRARVPSDPEPPVGTFVPCQGAEPTQSAPVRFAETYEAMEFVGDREIEAAVAQYVYQRYPRRPERFYHRLKKHVVRGQSLGRLGETLGFGRWVLLSPHAEEALTRANEALLEDVFEAWCCAVVLDQGTTVMRQMLRNVVEATIDLREAIINNDDYKDALARACSSRGWPRPQYLYLGDNGCGGPERRHTYAVVWFPECGLEPQRAVDRAGQQHPVWATASHHKKRRAQQHAAYNAMLRLETPRTQPADESR